MYFSSFHDFFNMGGYASYVWSSVAISLVLIISLFISAKWKQKSILASVKKEADSKARIAKSKQKGASF
ncbi:heme exporter protein CcmD [Vibrio viridaestus]|uniref:Heme exporter protein D n=1 Tax=Vibrio viridaestus TaxID=2487322 RepID=A0A3N9U7L4_9VIBR|nr:heme exporter protein CcmD [Vibrio viridaestus]RQW64166.1 heme exporter protein CcmD [Vibrio viridaestus]